MSVADDLFSPTFTVWAPFMDPSECIVIQPDAAFHQRLSGVIASGNTDPSQTDPQQIDLSNAASYDGTPLFSTSSDDQATASQAAPAIGQAMTSAGFGPSTSNVVSAAGANATLPKYTAYANLPAMSYSATNGQSITSSLEPCLARRRGDDRQWHCRHDPRRRVGLDRCDGRAGGCRDRPRWAVS